MNKKAQVLIITLWVLVILTILLVSIGHRVSMAIRISHYQRERLKAHYLAKAAANIVINELRKDNNGYDAVNEPWADGEESFKKIMLGENQNEFSSVGSLVIEGDKEVFRYGAVDEESKININTANKELLTALLEGYQIAAASDIADNIIIWRGDVKDDAKIYENLGYTCKADKFSTIEELKLVKDLSPEDFQRLNKIITVYGSGLVNINTVSSFVLNVMTRAIAKKMGYSANFSDSLTTKIIEKRNSVGFFKDKDEINIALTGEEEMNIFNELNKNIDVKSNNFLIEVSGNAGKINSKIALVYNRTDKKILYYHEN